MLDRSPPSSAPRAPVRVIGGRPARREIVTVGEPVPWRILLISAASAQLFALPLLSYMGWFLTSLVHEMGHAAMAWACGMPAFPAIRLDGHAAAVHADQVPWLVFVIAAAIAWAAWSQRELLVRAIPLGLLAIALPLLAFSEGPRDLAFLLMGHGGELLFAGLALHRACEIGSRETVERALYGTLAWYLLWKNVTLFFGLATSAEALLEYYGSGSFGLTNDLIRAAEDVLDTPVQSVAWGMFVATLLVIPATFLLRRVLRA